MTAGDSTGAEAVWGGGVGGHGVLWHVAPLLPGGRGQQLERKRHVGNDIVVVVFEVRGDPLRPAFRPASFRSHFTQLFAVVTFDGLCYRSLVTNGHFRTF